MPYAPEHRVETRTRILDSARRLFNRNGLTAISIDEVMAGAGLTRGAFYSYFDSKEELYAEAITHFINASPRPAWQGSATAAAADGSAMARGILDAYLSREHLADMEGSCPVIGLATDVARGGAAAKRAYHQVMMMMANIFAANVGASPLSGPDRNRDPAEDAERALAVVALCVGGMVLARAVDDNASAEAVRIAARKYASALAGWSAAADEPPDARI